MWAAAWVYSSEKNDELIDAVIEYQRLAAEDEKSSVVFALSPQGTGSLVGVMYALPQEFPAVFGPFYRITPDLVLFNSTVGTVADLSSRYNSLQFPAPGVSAVRNYVLSAAHTIHHTTYHGTYKAWANLSRQATSHGWSTTLGSQPMSLQAVRLASNTPLGLSPIAQDWRHVTMSWPSPADDVAATGLIHEMNRDISLISADNGSNLTYRFMNNAYEGQEVLRSYGVENWERMCAVSCKYDKDGVFQRLQNGGWLLSREGVRGCDE